MQIRFTTTILTIFLSCFSLFSAPPPPPGGGKPKCWPPPCVPIDGGLSLLMAAGALYGGKKIYDKSSKQKKD